MENRYRLTFQIYPGDLWRHCGGLGKEILMPYPINQSWREQIELNWIGARVGLWDTALKFLSRGPRNDVTDHLDPAWSPGPLSNIVISLFTSVDRQLKEFTEM